MIDPIKKALADLLHDHAEKIGQELVTTNHVVETEVQDVTPLRSQLRVRTADGKERYFTVVLQEHDVYQGRRST